MLTKQQLSSSRDTEGRKTKFVSHVALVLSNCLSSLLCKTNTFVSNSKTFSFSVCSVQYAMHLQWSLMCEKETHTHTNTLSLCFSPLLFLISSWCVEDHGSNLRVQPWVILNSWDWRKEKRSEEKRRRERSRQVWNKNLNRVKLNVTIFLTSPSYTELSSGWCMCGCGTHFSNHLCIACLSGSVRCQPEQWWYHYSQHYTDLWSRGMPRIVEEEGGEGEYRKPCSVTGARCCSCSTFLSSAEKTYSDPDNLRNYVQVPKHNFGLFCDSMSCVRLSELGQFTIENSTQRLCADGLK